MGRTKARGRVALTLLAALWLKSATAAARPAAEASPQPEPGAGSARLAPGAVDAERIASADAEPGQWLAHGRTFDEQRHSPLADIHRGNVARLGLAWSHAIGTKRGLEATPIVVDGVMYATGTWSVVFALDAATGRELWRHDPKVPRAKGRDACCDVVNRGVAVWKERVYAGTIDGRLVALDAATGEPVWEVQTVDPKRPYTITGAPRVVKDTPGEAWDYTATQHMVLADLEIGGAKREVLLQAPKNGFFYVLDRATGELLSAEKFAHVSWASHVDLATGRPVERRQARWGKGSAMVAPSVVGAHSWHPMSFHPGTGLVYIPAVEQSYYFVADPSFRYTPGRYNTGDPVGRRSGSSTCRVAAYGSSHSTEGTLDPIHAPALQSLGPAVRAPRTRYVQSGCRRAPAAAAGSR